MVMFPLDSLEAMLELVLMLRLVTSGVDLLATLLFLLALILEFM